MVIRLPDKLKESIVKHFKDTSDIVLVIPNGLLSGFFHCGSTRFNYLKNQLCGKYDFIENGIGKVTIDKILFEKWLSVPLSPQDMTYDELNDKIKILNASVPSDDWNDFTDQQKAKVLILVKELATRPEWNS